MAEADYMFDYKTDEVFFPSLHSSRLNIQDLKYKFAHYTTADVATSIFRNKQLWMRNTQAMNDSSEVMHGLQNLSELRFQPVWADFIKVLDSLELGLAAEVSTIFDDYSGQIQDSTFITCVSEHSAADDEFGRLSMWRAYGGRQGVALIFRAETVEIHNEPLLVQAMPVTYTNRAGFIRMFEDFVDGLKKEENADHLKKLDKNTRRNLFVHSLLLNAICTKHPGFQEEREWRIISAPPLLSGSEFVSTDIESVRGLPQIVKKMNLRDKPESNIIGVELHNLIEKVIIGPCDFPTILRDAICIDMRKAGFESPEEMVVISGIPYRHL